jgi:cobalt-zinc-cadmium efflux system protein
MSQDAHAHPDHQPGHAHDHPHRHDQAPTRWSARFALSVVLNLALVAVETVYGVLANSSALLADAGHNLSDVLSLLLAWGASWLATRRPTARRTYGLRRSSILAALLNAAILFAAIGAIAIEALTRFQNPQAIATTEVMAVAALGIAVNLGTAFLFQHHHGDLNVRGAFLHMLADAGVSLGVVIAAWLVQRTGLLWIDPAASLLIVVVIAVGTWGLLRDSVSLSLDAVPPGIDDGAVRRYLADLPGVAQVHDLHIWALSTTETALTAHLVRPAATLDDAFLDAIALELKRRFAIHHVTLQIECGDTTHLCPLHLH